MEHLPTPGVTSGPAAASCSALYHDVHADLVRFGARRTDPATAEDVADSHDARRPWVYGIPLAIANLKLIPVTLFPYGKEIVDSRTIAVAQRPLHSL